MSEKSDKALFKGKGKVDMTKEAQPGTEPVDGEDSVKGTPWYENSTLRERLMYTMQRRMAQSNQSFAENVERSKYDINFAYGDQWDAADAAERKADGKAVSGFNFIKQYNNLVIGTAKKSQIDINVAQNAGQIGELFYETGKDGPVYPIRYHEVVESIIRERSEACNAPLLYTNAMANAVEGGFGWLRIKTGYEHDDPFNIDFFIEHVVDQYSVYFDHYAKKPDLSDAKWMAVSTLMRRGEYLERYGDDKMDDLPYSSDLRDDQKQFLSGGEAHVRVIDYYFKRVEDIEYIRLEKKETGEEIIDETANIKAVLDELQEQGGYEIIARKKKKTERVWLMRCTSRRILEEPALFPGSRIPIVPVWGRTVWKEGKLQTYSLSHFAQDPQRALNYQWSAAAEYMSLAPKAMFTASAASISGYEDIWHDANKGKYAVLPYNAGHPDDANFRPPERIAPAPPAAGDMQMFHGAVEAIQSTMGLYASNLGQESNETSGIAIQRRQQAGDTGSYEFMDNLGNAVQSLGGIMCGIIPYLYSNKKARSVVLPDGKSAVVQFNQMVVDKQTGVEHRVGLMNLGKYRCAVNVGPAFATQQDIILETLNEFMKTHPDQAGMYMDLFFENMPIKNKSEFVKRAKFGVPKYALPKDEQELVPDPEPTPEQQASMAASKAIEAKAASDIEIADKQIVVMDKRVDEANYRMQGQAIIADKAESDANAAKLENEGAGGGGDGENGYLTKADAKRIFEDMMVQSKVKKRDAK